MKASLDGALVDETTTPSVSDGLLEIISVRKGAPRRLEAHLGRLRAGGTALGIVLPVGASRLGQWIAELIAANEMTEGALRLTLSRNPDGIRSQVLMAPFAANPYPEPAQVIVAAATRDETSPLTRIKPITDPVAAQAKAEAHAAGADDAILLNRQGRVAGATRGNVFLLVNGGLITPAVEEGAMPGVARADVIRLARAEEMPVTADLLKKASEAFLSSSLGIRPVVRINGEAVGDGEPGLITQLLATRI